MGRTVLAYAPAALVVGLMWMRLEDPVRDANLALWIGTLALLPALARRWWTRALGYAASVALAIGSTLAVSPLDPGRAAGRFRDGAALFYEEAVPIAPGEQPDMAAVLLLATFAFCALLALAVSARRPVLAAAVLVVGAGWPATLLPGGGDLVRGALILGAALVVLAALRAGAVRHALVAGAVVLAAAVGASASGAVDREALVDWERWDLYDAPPEPVGVGFVWDGRYAGVTFPERETTVLKIEAGPRRTYWRATTLDLFDEERNRWVEDNRPAVEPAGDGERAELTGDPLLPAAARNPANWRHQLVTVKALRDDHLVGASVPVAFDVGGANVRYGTGGVASLVDGRMLRPDETYRVWSYAPQPGAKRLASLPARYPEEIKRYRYLRPSRGISVPAFATPGRRQTVLDDLRSGFLPRAYRPLYETAREVVGDPATPYAAVLALETWFRSTGGFTYDERPGVTPGAPPLVDFLDRKRGYCQHFAGAMALMLRYLGIPSRVAVGFTSGEYDERNQTWTVTDHDAHAWVEVWFPEFGWLPFDPTPARGQLSGGYTASSDQFVASPDVAAALGGVAGALLRREGLQGLRGNQPTGTGTGGAGTLADGGRAAAPATLLGALVLLTLLVAAKEGRRRARYLGGDARSIARGARGDLAGFLADQGLEVPASATPAELAELVERRYEVSTGELAHALTAGRFAPRGAREARRARNEVREVRRRIRRRLSVRARARGFFSLRSLATP